jgi:cold shock protein
MNAPTLRRISVTNIACLWFNATKGFGFIQPEAVVRTCFVHISAVEKAGFSSLAEGAKVSYEIVSDRGKESAGNLRAG